LVDNTRLTASDFIVKKVTYIRLEDVKEFSTLQLGFDANSLTPTLFIKLLHG